jgi:hypothetical protein
MSISRSDGDSGRGAKATAMNTYRRERPCGSCGEPVLWLRHSGTGRMAPIEAKSDAERGNVLVDRAAGTYSLVPSGADRELHRGQLHLNHFVTCSAAKTWRKAGRR